MRRQKFRLAEGGLVDREAPVVFTFDGRRYSGFAGDTLASALLANGVRLVARSFKYHRPRGIMTAGSEEPNALVELRSGARTEPNTRATMVPLYDGLRATSQNRAPSLRFDLRAVNQLFAPFIPAGFYYKTFKWPRRWWTNVYEKSIRRAAGMGQASRAPDPDRYSKRHVHCEVLVVGGGPAGLAAALAAGGSGARVILCDESGSFGGQLRGERLEIAGGPALSWVHQAVSALNAMPNVTLLPRATAFGYYDHNAVGLVERVADHLPEPPPHTPRQRLWTVRAGQVVLATGAVERPLVFAGNDRPGVMLAAAARAYVNRFAVAPGRRAVVFTTQDDAYRTALDLHQAGIEVAAVVDARPEARPDARPEARPDAMGALPARVRAAGIPVRMGAVVARTYGLQTLNGVGIAPFDGHRVTGRSERVVCDLLCVSGGWTPAIQLHSQSGGAVAWDDAKAAFLPGAPKQASRSAGACAGTFTLPEILSEGVAAGTEAARAAGFEVTPTSPPATEAVPELAGLALWDVGPSSRGGGKRFVDHQDDVTADDVALAHREGYRSVEHLKRYTTLGMGTDQGKTSNLNGHALMAMLRGESIPTVGTTTFRPPVTPVAFGALAGAERGLHFAPIRRSPMHDRHEAMGAAMLEAGQWMRPRCYPRPGESPADAVRRETAHVRQAAGMVDVSTLGKIDLQGADTGAFLDRIYLNSFGKLAIGKARYGLMLREDGFAFDDGTCARIAANRWFMTTTSANAAAVLAHLEFHLQAVWPELDVQVASVTDAWAGIAVAGPRSREVLSGLVAGNLEDAALPFMGAREDVVAGIPALLLRISYSGERAYEVYVPSDCGTALWDALIEAGAAQDLQPYGTEAMGNMRIEKGHVAGPELDGRTTPADLGLGRMVAAAMRRADKDFIGRAMLQRPALQDADRPALVGIVPADGKGRLRAGAHLIEEADALPPVSVLGRVTSVGFSPTLGHQVALGFVAGGLQHAEETLYAAFPMAEDTVPVRIVPPVFVDPEGARLHG